MSRRVSHPNLVEAHEFPTLHARAGAELRRMAAAWPDKVVFAVLPPDSPAFRIYVRDDRKLALQLARQGNRVFILRQLATGAGVN